MYCNINEAFGGGNSMYIKNVLDNELNNTKLLEKYNNFDTYFTPAQKELQQNLSNNLVEHFTNQTTTLAPQPNEPICEKSLEHIVSCSNCKKQLIKIYINNFFNGFTSDNYFGKSLGSLNNIISIFLLIILFIIAIKLINKI
jgi:hypothetical protein